MTEDAGSPPRGAGGTEVEGSVSAPPRRAAAGTSVWPFLGSHPLDRSVLPP